MAQGKSIRPSRVNISLALDQSQSQERKELPLKLLVLSDLSKHGSKSVLRERKRCQINRQNFNQVLAQINPQLALQVQNHVDSQQNELTAKLSFSHINDFSPDNIIGQVPELKRLLGMRNLLKDLKSNLIDNKQLQKKLTEITQDRSQSLALQNFLKKYVQDNSKGKD